MAIAILLLQMANEFLHVVDVIIEMKFAIRERHKAGILPIGDEDFVALQHGAHGVAQQSRVVARQRRNDQYSRLAFEAGEGGGIV